MARGAKEIRDLNAELAKSLELQDEISETEQKVNEFIQDRAKLLEEQLDNQTELTKGEKDLAKVLKKGLNGSKAGLAIQKKILQIKSKIFGYDNDSAQAAVDVVASGKKSLDLANKYNKLKAKGLEISKKMSKFSEASGMGEALDEADGMIGGLGKKLVAMILSPITMIGAALGLGISTYGRYSEVIDKTGQIFGAQVGMADDLKDAMFQVNAEGAELDINIESIAGMLPDISNEFGKSSAASVKLAAKMKETALATGLADGQATALFSSMMNVMDMSAEAAENFSKGTYYLAQQEGVAPQAVMQDIAESSEMISDFGKDGAANIAKAAINAKKFGVSLKTVEKIANSLLNFEDSIAKEMEASVMIGRNLNFNAARRLALEGDLDGAVQDILGQLGGQEEFARMDVLQKRALADAIGITTTELAKYMNKQGEVNAMGEVTGQQVKDIGAAGYVDASKSMSELQKTNNYIKNAKDVLIPGMKDQFEKVDTVVQSIKKAIQWIVTTLGGFGLMGTMMFMGFGQMLMKSKMIKKLWKGIGGLLQKGWKKVGAIFGASKKTQANVAKKIAKATGGSAPGKKKKKGFFGRMWGGIKSGISKAKKGLKKLKPKKGWFSGLKNIGSKMWKGVKGAGKWIGKKVGKGALKGLLKKIPGVGLIAGLGFGASRLLQGDWKGALGEVASGAASLIPGAGTAVSTAIDAGLMARDAGMIGDGTITKDGKIVRFSSGDDLIAYNAQRMAQLGGSGVGGTGTAGAGEIGQAVYEATMAANRGRKTIVTRDEIYEVTQERGY